MYIRSLLAAASVAAFAFGGIAAASSASAATSVNAPVSWSDTALQVSHLHSTCPVHDTELRASVDGSVVTVTPVTSGDVLTWTALPDHVTEDAVAHATDGSVAFTSANTTDGGNYTAVDTYAAGCAEAVQVSVAAEGAQTLGVIDTGGHISSQYVVGGVQFDQNANDPETFNFSIPSGVAVSNGELTVANSTAHPGDYSSNGVTATDSLGAQATSAFELEVDALPVFAASQSGDEVNKFGNGFDVFQQHYANNAVVAGWTATKNDPATHFVRVFEGNGWRFEAVRANGIASGLCVSDPGSGYSQDPVADGLVLRYCNLGNFQKFSAQSDGTLKNVATGLVVNPAGNGAQLRGGTSPVPWGGSVYNWTDYNSLPV